VIARAHAELGERVEVLTPDEPDRRGCQLSLRIASRTSLALVARALRRAGVVADVREPNVLRLAPVPLYNRFRDVYVAVRALRHALAST
jgi:kynureninase